MTTQTVYVRQSGLGSFDKCGRAFQYGLELDRSTWAEGGSIQRAMGTGYHADKEAYYAGELLEVDDLVERALCTMHEEVRKIEPANFKWSDAVPDVDAADLKLANMVRSYFEQGHQWADPYTVVGVEVTFGYDEDLEIRGVPVRGAIDLVLEDPSGWITIVDHKTAGRKWDQGKHKARKQNQPPFYIGVAQHLWPDRPGYRFIYDIMTYKGEFERRVSGVHEGHVMAVFEKAQQILALYKGMRSGGMDLPVNPSSNLCSPAFCDFWSICSQGAALD